MTSREYAYERLLANLEKLEMKGMLNSIDGLLERAIHDEMAAVEVIDELFQLERDRREESSRVTRLRLSGLPSQKRLEGFDFDFQPSIDEKLVRDLSTLRFVHNRENVILLGPPGVGKTHLAIGLAMEAVEAGMMVYFTTGARLIDRLQQAVAKGNLDRKLKSFCKYRLLVVDEVGYLPLKEQGADLFFQVVSQLYERGSIVLTSNMSFGEWGTMFGNHVVAAAVLDRLLHHSVVLNIRGESYRMRQRSHTPNPFHNTAKVLNE